jgi:hypothetical protein
VLTPTIAQNDIWSTASLVLFLSFFIPGFVSLKIYDLIIPGARRDFSKSIFEIIGYSALNYAFFFFVLGSLLGPSSLTSLSWPAILADPQYFYIRFGWFGSAILLSLALVALPCAWPVIFCKLFDWKWIAKRTVSPIPKPWDYVFGGYATKKRDFWIIVHLNDGSRIGGKFGQSSYASSYPEEEQLYLQEIYAVDENGNFDQAPLPNSEGMIIFGRDIKTVELIR